MVGNQASKFSSPFGSPVKGPTGGAFPFRFLMSDEVPSGLVPGVSHTVESDKTDKPDWEVVVGTKARVVTSFRRYSGRRGLKKAL